MRVVYKIWLEHEGKVFGQGPARLLDGVERTGSLRKAASELGMSYNKAWLILHAAEQRLGFALLDRSVGGTHGGGSRLTPRGQDLLNRYRALITTAGEALKQLFQEQFADWEEPSQSDASTGPSPED